ncbi:MalY/PatB family protein [Bacteroides helcogenes]|uniref:cysteine-S-conjugate beta-lyase n=1 Tax=Bacteroides helcogenes (strain ATCC 35417 / DSM 20613 / JCM 6297 / CCUG 15421 / P 36-108) TaxID=693979 RepID=E6ST36_BACT6|nr:PatB family C-S lyase [Bacteroides helcogenes]ADV45240.1 aminotransferase class I and II [Bacteroides helcogenes P 36-108]MDY5238801.1 PatB family C-S lyase [Bacteroides helcogenes]
METYDFDKIIDRRGTGALKLDVLQERYGRADLLPLWVADMDFETPAFITEALRRRLEHSLYGYTKDSANYWPTVINWIASHHGWQVEREWLTYIPGIVKGIGMVINVFVKPDEKVIIQPPVYHPFRLTPQGNGREVVYNPLREHADGSYSMDFENLEAVADDKCRLLILSNPHNPAGIVWDKETLVRLADFCHRRHILVISDEIHCDMALFGHKHLPFASVSPEAAACSITFGAPSKTFNIAGIVSSYAIVPNRDIRERFYGWLEANELNEAPLFAPISTIAAFSEGEAWRKQMLRYVEGNVDFVIDFCARHLPQIKPLRPQASFLVWLDCRGLHLSHDELQHLFVEEARLALNDGEMFGQGGEGFMRLNVGSPRSVLRQAMEQLAEAVRRTVKLH